MVIRSIDVRKVVRAAERRAYSQDVLRRAIHRAMEILLRWRRKAK